MELPVYSICGHHLRNLRDYAQQGSKFHYEITKKEHGEEFAVNAIKIWEQFLNRKCAIKLIVGKLDDLCLCKCKKREEDSLGVWKWPPLLCEGSGSEDYDKKIIEDLHLEIGKEYIYDQIEESLMKYHIRYYSDP